MDLRELKGLEIAARCKIEFKDNAWLVPSQSTNVKYRVVLTPGASSCTCEDFQLHQKVCKHIHAARLVQERDYGGQAPIVVADAVPKRPTYKQDWEAYNEAQITERHRLQVLLHDLCRGLEDPPREPTLGGRKPTPIADQVFVCVFKVFSTYSSRRFGCDLKDAHEKGYLSKPLHPNKANTFLEREELTPVLRSLITKSSLPLRAVETTFAPDSSGFSTGRFIRWYDEKYGVEKSGKDWVKVHIMTGVQTHTIVAAEIHGRDAGDSPILPSLLKTTKDHGFDVREVPADKGYSSIENVTAIYEAGATPYIAFKSNNTGYSGGLWEKAYLFYALHREEFLKRYHQRSNVESTFSMIKRKFNDYIRAKGDVAMTNEVLAKLLCHNICVLIQSQCELGIEATFWGEKEPKEGGAILKFPGVG
jgi:transposase